MNDILEKKLNSLDVKRHIKKNKTLANYQPYKIINNLIFISGQLPLDNSGMLHTGKVSKDFSKNKIQTAVEIATSNLLWNLCDSIKNVKLEISVIYCCNIKGYFNSVESFEEHSKLLDFASNLIVKVLGKSGEHSRVAVGVSSFPKNSFAEIEGIFSIS